MMEMVKNSVNDFWKLPKCGAIIVDIVMAAVLLCFDLEISKTVKEVILWIYLGLSLIVEYNQVLRKLRESNKSTKEISCTVKSNVFLPQETNHDLDTKGKLTENIKIDYKKNLHGTSVVNPNSEIGTKIENLLNQIAKEGENIQGKLEKNKCTKEISSTVKSNGFLRQSTNHDLDTKDKLTKKTKTDCTRNLECTSNANQNSDTVTKDKNLQNQIAKEEEDIKCKLEKNKCTKEIPSTINKTRFRLQAVHHDLDTKDKLTRKTKIVNTRNSEFTSNMNRNSQILSQKGNMKNQIAEVEDIQHRCICSRHAKLFSSTVKRKILPQVPRQILVTKDKLAKKTVQVPKINPAHRLLASMLEYEGTYEVTLRRARKFIRIIISLTVDTYFKFLIKRPFNKQNYNRLDDISNLEKTDLIFYKTTSPIKHNTEAVISLKSLPKIPMRPYVSKVSFTPLMRELSRKRYVDSVSMRESEMRKNNKNILKYIHRNTKFLPTCQIKHHWNSVNEMPLSFQRPDFLLDPPVISNEI